MEWRRLCRYLRIAWRITVIVLLIVNAVLLYQWRYRPIKVAELGRAIEALAVNEHKSIERSNALTEAVMSLVNVLRYALKLKEATIQ